MFDAIKKFIANYRKPLSASRTGLLKDAAYAGVRVGKFVDSALGASDRISKAAFNKFGPASPRLINAADRVSRSPIVAKGVAWATQGGPLTKAGKFGWGVGKAADSRWNLSDRAAKGMMRAFGPRPTVHTAIARGLQKPSKPFAASLQQLRAPSPPMPTFKLHLPKFGRSLPHANPLSLHTPKLHLSAPFRQATPVNRLPAPFKLTAPTFRAPSQMHRPSFSAVRHAPTIRFHR